MLFAFTIFLSSFFLFQVQPIVGKYLLPLYGGSPAVWSVCLFFFQAGLLTGYFYAHLLRRFLAVHHQVLLHCFLLVLSLFFIPLEPGYENRITAHPSVDVILILLGTVFCPYVLLCATAPLLQHWFSIQYIDKSPYRLYALSNVASLLALLSYPFILEPFATLIEQRSFWSWGYGVFTVSCITVGWLLYFSLDKRRDGLTTRDFKQVSFAKKIEWLVLSAVASLALLATTSRITQDVAVVPFLWVLPLSLYLLSFIIPFDNPKRYQRKQWIFLFLFFLAAALLLLWFDTIDESVDILIQLAVYVGLLFAICMICHGELAIRAPQSSQLTSFYLVVALGGACGGFFTSFIAPFIFKGYWEYHLTLLFSLLLVGYVASFNWKLRSCLNLLLIVCLVYSIYEQSYGAREMGRNFYGVLSVFEKTKKSATLRKLYHGSINHGAQFIDGSLRRYPISYYSKGSGIGVAIRKHPRRKKAPMHIGLIGLGVGTISAYTEEKDTLRIYEINPYVERLARKWFTYLKDAKGDVRIILGDGRLSLEEEYASLGSNEFDVLAIDAFSGDAIPTHLLTKEAVELYSHHLKDDGILAFHISNKYLNLKPILYAHANSLGYQTVLFRRRSDAKRAILRSTWLLLTNNEAFLRDETILAYQSKKPKNLLEIHWTDNYSNLFNILK